MTVAESVTTPQNYLDLNELTLAKYLLALFDRY